jgi:hypothetical protein
VRPRITPWERKFFEKLDDFTNLQVLRAADYMGIEYLLMVSCQFAVTSLCFFRMVNQPASVFFQSLSEAAMRHILMEYESYNKGLVVRSSTRWMKRRKDERRPGAWDITQYSRKTPPSAVHGIRGSVGIRGLHVDQRHGQACDSSCDS